MKAEDKEQDTMWQYVLDGLSPEERAAYERLLQQNPGKKAEADRLLSMSRKLDRLMPATDLTDDRLRERIYLDMNREVFPSEAKDQTADTIIPFPRRARRILTLGGPLALAAALLLVMGLPNLIGPLAWKEPRILQLSGFRSEDGAALTNALYSRQDYRDMFAQLKRLTDAAYAERVAEQQGRSFFRRLRKDWMLAVSFQETQPGRLAVAVVALRPGREEPLFDLNEYYGNRAAFDADCNALARRLADRLVQTLPP